MNRLRISSEADVQALVDNRVSESRTLDFKRELDSGQGSGMKGAQDWTDEFLKDVTALANTYGGQILYGVEEENGVAKSIPGFVIENIDGLRNRLTTVVLSRTSPRLSGMDIDAIKLTGSNRFVLCVRVARATKPPHAVQNGRRLDFWARNMTDNYRLDVQQLRELFRAADESTARFREFRKHREAEISKIASSHNSKAIVVHWFPEHALPEHELVVEESLPQIEQEWLQPPAFNRSNELPLPNFAGIHRFRPWVRHEVPQCAVPYGHCQLFRIGIVEGCSVFPEGPFGLSLSEEEGAELLLWLKSTADMLIALGIPPFPGYLSLSLIGPKTLTLSRSSHLPSNGLPLDGEYTFPEVYVESTPKSWISLCSPLLNHLWQAAGLATCPWVSPEGRWQPNYPRTAGAMLNSLEAELALPSGAAR